MPDPTPPIRIPLTQLEPGRRATVECSALDALPEGDRCLLTAMGLGERCEVRLCRLGQACIVQVDTTRLGIDERVAARIMVTPIDDAS